MHTGAQLIFHIENKIFINMHYYFLKPEILRLVKHKVFIGLVCLRYIAILTILFLFKPHHFKTRFTVDMLLTVCKKIIILYTNPVVENHTNITFGLHFLNGKIVAVMDL